MPKFRKRPIVIEAFQMTIERRWSNEDWPEWLHEAWNKCIDSTGALFIDSNDPTGNLLIVKTLEGNLTIMPGSWIIQGVRGELYPCDGGIFRETYEEVGE
jgi:hypothetical protein